MKVVIALAITVLLSLPILLDYGSGNQAVLAAVTGHKVVHNSGISKHSLRHLLPPVNTGASKAYGSKKERNARHHLLTNSSGRYSRRHSTYSNPETFHKKHRHMAPKTRYAYPMSLFLYEPPSFDLSPLPEEQSLKIRKAFAQGTASEYPTRSLVRAKLVTYYPIRGGIFFRREPIKNIIIHSTEPGISVGAKVVIDGWSHGGRRHPGAHYVVERDGTIYQALDPDLAAVHVNIFKTLPGFDNDNSVGIEMCHQGSQSYTPEQVQSVVKLVVYLQNHYHVSDSNIVTHRYAQQGDHTDPVNFAWDDFISDKSSLQTQSLNYRLADLKAEAIAWQPIAEPSLSKSKIFPVKKSVVIDLTKISGAPTVPKNKANTAQVDSVKAAPIPSSVGANLVPVTSGSVSRLVPAAPVSRLIPPSQPKNATVNTGISGGIIQDIDSSSFNRKNDTVNSNNTINSNDSSLYKSIDEAAPNPPEISNSKKLLPLPLRGPIEMDPNEAADLLNEGTDKVSPQ